MKDHGTREVWHVSLGHGFGPLWARFRNWLSVRQSRVPGIIPRQIPSSPVPSGVVYLGQRDFPNELRYVAGRFCATMSENNSYVRVDENGVYRVGTTRVMLDSVVAAFRQGHSAETIKQQFPALSLEEVYGSIAYYLAHAAEIDAYLQRQDAVWEELRSRSEEQPSAVVERLRALTNAGARETR
jgi:uncharacterized protein (DUF433 family)